MDFLKEWVRGLVTLVLLAGALEMLIPSNGMKKYVRMTMGLVIVLAVVRPITVLVGRPIDPQALSVYSDLTDAHGLPTLEQIMADAALFRSRNQKLATDDVRLALANQARAAALRVKGVSQVWADVTLTDPGQGIQRVSLSIMPGTASPSVTPIAPVRPGPSAGGERPTPEPVPLTSSERELIQEIKSQVAKQLSLDLDTEVVRVFLVRQDPTARR